MRRWNGWGDDETLYPLPESAARFLNDLLGKGQAREDASLNAALRSLPASRLSPGEGVDTEPLARLRHARGQSLPDWIALRSGAIGPAPDGVATPSSANEVEELIRRAVRRGWRLIPYGGGTSVVGHINPLPGERPCITLDLRRLKRLIDLDEENHLATFEAGVSGPALEAQLRTHGYVLGHYPQSWEYSTLGGWIATRSSGQQSFGYGRIEELFAGGSLLTPAGTLTLPAFPASAAGPDLRQVVLGSEGRLGMITHAIVRVRPLPEHESFRAAFFPAWEDGLAAARDLAREPSALSMIRISDSLETRTTLVLSGRERLVRLAQSGLRLIGFGGAPCLMILALTGSRRACKQSLRWARSVIRRHGGLPVGRPIGETWRKSRFRTPYLRNTLWERGYALDTLETAVTWSRIAELRAAALSAIQVAMEGSGARVLVFSHLSHVYPDGASLYITYLFPRRQTPQEDLETWSKAKRAASEAIVAHGGTISHQHGIGLDHKEYLGREKGSLGLTLLERLRAAVDPEEVLNPGKLLPANPEADRPAGGSA